MFQALSEKFSTIFSKLGGQRKLTEKNIQDAVGEVRLALLDADVQYGVVKTFIKKVKERAVGQELMGSVQPGQQFVKIVHDELIDLMGAKEHTLVFSEKPARMLLCGLQGSGKTTHAVKLARFLQKQGRFSRPCVVACDLQRPAAVEQLKTLAEQAEVAFFALDGNKDPACVAQAACKEQKSAKWDCLIFDTAGRLHIDDDLMAELEQIKQITRPEEILFVANAATGQDAVKAAKEFHDRIAFTGSIVTMLDGSAKGGAAISIKEVTSKPLKFEGIGEKIDDIQPFNPNSMADRILGMGDTINLVRKAQEHISEEDARDFEQKLKQAAFTYEDYLKQMQSFKKMGSFKSILKMLPAKLIPKEFSIDEGEVKKIEAIILSMTPDERREKVDLSIQRRRRIAKGSGVLLEDVNKLRKSFQQAKQFFKKAPKQMQKMLGGSLWH